LSTEEHLKMLASVINRVTEHDEEAEYCILCTVTEALSMIAVGDDDASYFNGITQFFIEEKAYIPNEWDEEETTPFERKWVRQ